MIHFQGKPSTRRGKDGLVSPQLVAAVGVAGHDRGGGCAVCVTGLSGWELVRAAVRG